MRRRTSLKGTKRPEGKKWWGGGAWGIHPCKRWLLLTVANLVPPISIVRAPLIRAEESSGCFYIVLRMRYKGPWGDRKVCIWKRDTAPVRVNIPFACALCVR